MISNVKSVYVDNVLDRYRFNHADGESDLPVDRIDDDVNVVRQLKEWLADGNVPERVDVTTPTEAEVAKTRRLGQELDLRPVITALAKALKIQFPSLDVAKLRTDMVAELNED